VYVGALERSYSVNVCAPYIGVGWLWVRRNRNGDVKISVCLRGSNSVIPSLNFESIDLKSGQEDGGSVENIYGLLIPANTALIWLEIHRPELVADYENLFHKVILCAHDYDGHWLGWLQRWGGIAKNAHGAQVWPDSQSARDYASRFVGLFTTYPEYKHEAIASFQWRMMK